MTTLAPSQTILTVSQLNSTVRRLLESEFAGIWLTGEISNFAKPSSGHWYFSLKDNGAQIRGAMFKGNNRSCRIQPRDGIQVLVRARISLYEPRGDYQIIVEQMEPAGDGLLKQQFEQLKNQLAAEGLFAQAHKQPLPTIINRVGIITSPTGAAVRDIISVLKRRAPQLEVIIYPTAVQGYPATEQIVAMIQLAQQRNEVDVLIVGRGGGSLEDLWCFNEAALARAIYYCSIPIVSAVGHEVDVTISDFVADVRAATPSAAAELISPDSVILIQQLEHYRQQLTRAITRRLTELKHSGSILEQQLLRLHPQHSLNRHSQKVDEMALRLHSAIKNRIAAQQSRLNQLVHQFKMAQNTLNITRYRRLADQLAEQLYQGIQIQLSHRKIELDHQAQQLDIVSPLSTLGRGYSITLDEQQQLIRSVDQVKEGDIIQTRMIDGTVKSRVLLPRFPA